MIWLDAQISPHIATWISANFGETCIAVRDLGLKDADDWEIFLAAKAANAIVITKDADFLELLLRLKAPPKIIWLTCGNTTTKRLGEILRKQLPLALTILKDGEDLVEISD